MKKSVKKIEKYFSTLCQELPHICPHEEDDWEWRDEGMELMGSGDLPGAEKKFKELILAEPQHHDGYEGLALVYQKLGRREEALLLIDHAVTLAEGFLEEGTLDPEVLEEIKEERRQILKMD